MIPLFFLNPTISDPESGPILQMTSEHFGEPSAKLAKIDVAQTRRIIPILGDATTSETVPLAEFYVVHLEDKKKINPFLKKIPLVSEKLDHLKRVDKSGRILVQCVDHGISVELLHDLKEFDIEESDLQVAQVPASKPATRRQFDWGKQYWPTSFHPNKDDRELACGSRTDRLLGHPVMTMVQNLARCERRYGDYLATGCEVYLRNEPCAMCAMALVHCRAASVFYCRNTVNGVLAQGKWQLHLEPAINHHYRVFHVEMEVQEEETAVCGK
ncbi:hypothetical protein NECAME_17097 [Necator americanus]|uniref:CMP/dCMP-type deaminase domain-containing protein n=1 Tax=Necator americanus TaxID=51031 RepID=W2TRV7_NECAM|nr:hypothetical protein NECAME_17097 [Necator americanus]ETN84558.1 hypothetical protein NECAME_17097 [Necator americanus]